MNWTNWSKMTLKNPIGSQLYTFGAFVSVGDKCTHRGISMEFSQYWQLSLNATRQLVSVKDWLSELVITTIPINFIVSICVICFSSLYDTGKSFFKRI